MHLPSKSPTTKASVRRDQPNPPQWPSYNGVSRFVGTSSLGVTVYVDPTLGAPGLQNAQDLLADADRVVAANNAIFGIIGGPVNAIVFALGGATDGTGGADHGGCDFTTGANIEVCAAFGQSAKVSALFEAELSECAMNGQLCGFSTGEALSRWCAAVVGNNALSDFASAPAWAQAGFPDYVDQTDPTDQNPISIGCGMAFISWLLSQGHTLETIAQAMVSLGDSGTLTQLYNLVTGDIPANAWPTFAQAVSHQGGITNDDPFGGLSGAKVNVSGSTDPVRIAPTQPATQTVSYSGPFTGTIAGPFGRVQVPFSGTITFPPTASTTPPVGSGAATKTVSPCTGCTPGSRRLSHPSLAKSLSVPKLPSPEAVISSIGAFLQNLGITPTELGTVAITIATDVIAGKSIATIIGDVLQDLRPNLLAG